MIKPRYYFAENAPLKYYKFLKYFGMPFGAFSLLASFVTALLSGSYHWIDICYNIAVLILFCVSYAGLISFAWFGARFMYATYALVIGYNIAFCIVHISLSIYDYLPQLLGNALGSAVAWLLIWVYFSKRRPLFSPWPHKDSRHTTAPCVDYDFTPPVSPAEVDNLVSGIDVQLAPPAPAEVPICDTSSPAERPSKYSPEFEKRLAHMVEETMREDYEKEEVFRCCPRCGSLSPYTDSVCSCGYHFMSDVTKALHKQKKSPSKIGPIIILSIVFLCLAGGLGYSVYLQHNTTVALEREQNNSAAINEKYISAKQDYLSSQVSFDKLQDKYDALKKDFDALDLQFHLALVDLGFYYTRIGYIVDGSSRYHSFDCEIFRDADEYWAHNVEYCEYLGYSKCSSCYQSTYLDVYDELLN